MGLYAWQIIEKALGWQKYEGNNLAVKFVRICITFFLVNIAWIFFRMPDIASASTVVSKIFTSFGMPDLSGLDIFAKLILAIGVAILVFKDVKDEFLSNRFKFLNKGFFRWSIYIALFAMILTLGVLDSGQFIYVNF